MFGAFEEGQEQKPGRQDRRGQWEMRDVIALATMQKLQEFHGTREEAVENAEADSDAAYEIANRMLCTRSKRKDEYFAGKRKQGVGR